MALDLSEATIGLLKYLSLSSVLAALRVGVSTGGACSGATTGEGASGTSSCGFRLR